MKPVGDLLGDQGGVAAGAVVDDEIDLEPVLYGLVHDVCRVFDHLRIQHAADHFVKREGLGIGFLVAHPEGGDEAVRSTNSLGNNIIYQIGSRTNYKG